MNRATPVMAKLYSFKTFAMSIEQRYLDFINLTAQFLAALDKVEKCNTAITRAEVNRLRKLLDGAIYAGRMVGVNLVTIKKTKNRQLSANQIWLRS